MTTVNSNETIATRPRRGIWRWLVPRFSLRTLLIVVTVVSVFLGTWIT